MKNIGILLACLFGTCPATSQTDGLTLAALEPVAGMERQLYDPFDGATVSGNYLAGRFAQQHHDWSHASVFMDAILAGDSDDATLVKRAMVIAMGSGNTDKAIALSKRLLEMETDSSLALLFLAVDSFKKENYAAANEFLKRVPANGSSDFIVPVLKSWADAAQGKYDPGQLNDTSVHIYHAIMIADFMKEHSHVVKLLEGAMANETVAPADMERVADIYAHIKKPEKAIALYKKVLEATPGNSAIAEKIAKLQNGQNLNLYEPITSAPDGVAMALYDMAQSLYQEYSDDSARVFAHMVIYLKPDLTKANQMLAEISARHDQFAEAINYYHGIKPGSENYAESRRRAAELLEEAGQVDKALAELNALIVSENDLEAMIQVGDVYRRKEDFSPAIEYYNQAAATFGGEIPAEYWHLYYVRGMCYERVGQWSKAEADLKAALAFQPEHPFVLNYLGYAWADQGLNLSDALGMIRKAVALRPADGYITDSLGWVLYRMGEHQDAIPHLEKAVELLPYDPVVNDHLGDAYWKVGRKLEAKFQWNRAKENSEDLQLIGKLESKLAGGITTDDVKRAEVVPPDAGAIINR